MKTILVMLLIDGCTSKMIEVLIDGCTSNDSNGYLNSKTDLPILDHQRSHSPIDRPEQCQEPRLSQQRIGTSWGYLMGDVSWYFFRFMIFGVYPCLIYWGLPQSMNREIPQSQQKNTEFSRLLYGWIINRAVLQLVFGLKIGWLLLVILTTYLCSECHDAESARSIT